MNYETYTYYKTKNCVFWFFWNVTPQTQKHINIQGPAGCANRLNPPPPPRSRSTSVPDESQELTRSKASASFAYSAGPTPKENLDDLRPSFFELFRFGAFFLISMYTAAEFDWRGRGDFFNRFRKLSRLSSPRHSFLKPRTDAPY